MGDEVPLTIKNAMGFVSELGERYLWVDALCILQDDIDDQSRLIPLMDSIYAFATLTIIVAGGDNVRSGIPGLSSNSRQISQDVIRISDGLALISTPHVDTAFYHCAWKTRAWTLQERICSRRTLIFTADQAYWSCACADWLERLALEVAPPYTLKSKDSLGCYDFWDLTRTTKKLNFSLFNNIVMQYTRRELTNAADGLDAISGLLRRITAISGQRFHWGHPCARFDESLAWVGDRSSRREALCRMRRTDGKIYYVPFPSWSWAGWRGPAYKLPAKPGMFKPELDIFRVGVDGRLARVMDETNLEEFNAGSSTNDDGGFRWKGRSTLKEDDFPSHNPFGDSGRLQFWTSHARLSLTVSSDPHGVPLWTIVDVNGDRVGKLGEYRLQELRENELYSFIVVSRLCFDSRSMIRPVDWLNVLLVTWDKDEPMVASRITVGSIQEEVWEKLKPEWILVTLQ
jgi:hypothetical protein